ncbi:unnamed protein product [Rotaria sp. Silwood1]|nr:unnamed protein product [Rotaria sp. Silwood1]CAF3712290.1 unnamed protein product [Rotaria sp. Silwood1]
MIKLFSLCVIFSSILATKIINAQLWNETYPKGEIIPLGEFNIYSIGKSNRNLAIIVMYDNRGFNTSQTRVFCDRLAAEYFVHVVMPDFFRGTSVPTNGSTTSWLETVSNWTRLSSDLQNVANWLDKQYSIKQIGLIGFCWGGLHVVRACSNLPTIFFTGISIHGAQITPDEVRKLQRPMLFIAASNDPPLQPNISSVIEQANPNISQQCEYKTYTNMRHGFAAGGANYSNPDNVKAIDDVHETVRNYLDKLRKNMSVSLSINFFVLLILLIFVFNLHI